MVGKTRYIKHPSWRVYKAILDCKLNVEDYNLKDFEKANSLDINKDRTPAAVYMPSSVNDDLTNELCKALTDINYKDELYCVSDCLSTFINVEGRQLIEVMLLNGRPIADITEAVGCSSDFALTYQSLFYDTTVFKSNSDKLVYLHEGTSGQDASLKSLALEQGEEYLKIKSSVPASKISIDNLLSDIIVTSYKSMHKNVTNDDISSQEVSQGWANMALKGAVELRKNGVNSSSIDDLLIALTTTAAPEKSIDDLD